jgi:SPP1 gp7 family putative phage head morphogenesis protein
MRVHEANVWAAVVMLGAVVLLHEAASAQAAPCRKNCRAGEERDWSQGNFVRDEYGRRLDDFGRQARAIVAYGLEQGLGRDDIASSLSDAAEVVFVRRARSYWDVVASAFVGQGRSFAQMSSYAEAGVRTYVIEAVLDEVTTPVCRFMHGKTFSVSDALRRFDQGERMDNPEDIKQLMPWVRGAVDGESGRSVLFVNGTTGRTPVAEVLQSGVGNRDDRGEFRAMASDRQLGNLGVGMPPFHGRCPPVSGKLSPRLKS